jgi:hypothetical protein
MDCHDFSGMPSGSTRNLLRKWDCLRLRIFLSLPSRPALLLCFGDSLSSSCRHSPLLGSRDLCATIVSGFGPSCLLRSRDPCPPRRRDLSSAVLFAICRTKGFERRGDSFNLFRQVIVFFAQKLNYAANIRHFEIQAAGTTNAQIRKLAPPLEFAEEAGPLEIVSMVLPACDRLVSTTPLALNGRICQKCDSRDLCGGGAAYHVLLKLYNDATRICRCRLARN